MSFTQTSLRNGAKVILAPFSGTEAATILVLFGVGARYEDEGIWGASHFLEHLMFKGTERRRKTADISKELDRYGAHYNAYTGKDITGYWVKIAGSELPVAIDLLWDMIFHSRFDAEEMEREKQVIIEEIKMYEENPIMHLEDVLEEAMFDGHVLGKNIAGTPESVKAMKREDVLEYYRKHYSPQNMTIVVSGNVSATIIDQLESTFGTVPGAALMQKVEFSPITKEVLLPRVRFQQKPVEQVQLALGFPTVGRGHDDVYALKLLSAVLGGTMSSRLFVEVRESRGLCYNIHTSTDAFQDTGIFSVRAGLDAGRIGEAMRVICDELQKVVDLGVDAEELAMVKDHIRGGVALSLEDSASRAEYYGRQMVFLNSLEDPEERMKRFDAVTLEDIHRVARQYLAFDRMSLAAIGPFEGEADLAQYLPKK